MQLMVAATLILLCTKPMDAVVLGPVPWLVTVPSIAIIGREVRYRKLIVSLHIIKQVALISSLF